MKQERRRQPQACLALHLAVYIVFWITAVISAGGGHGSYTPMGLYWSWAAVAMMRGPDIDSLIFLTSALLLLLYAVLWFLFRVRPALRRAAFLLPLLHLSGAIVVVTDQRFSDSYIVDHNLGIFIVVFSWVTALALMSIYWFTYLWTLNR